MRKILLPALAIVLGGSMAQAASAQDAAPPRFARPRLFVGPMGEPFRGGDGIPPEEAWFRGADKNGDGQLTLVEFTVDAARFFATLDLNHNGEIGPDEIDHYEAAVLPEVHGGAGGGGGPGGWRGGGDRRGRHGGQGGFGGRGMRGGGGGGAEDGAPGLARQPLRGAARYGYLALPEPVVAADTDLNRAVTSQEFAQAAERRFALLDANHDGVITRDELPDLRARVPRHRHRHMPPAQDGD